MLNHYCHETAYHQFIVIPKNGCTSILSNLYHMENLTVEQVHAHAIARAGKWNPDGKPTFAVVRDPWKRFLSTWHNKVHKPHRPDTSLLRTKGVSEGMSLNHFCEWFLREGRHIDEPHLRPQASYLPSMIDPDFCKIDLLPHCELDEVWKKYGYAGLYGELPHRNSSNWSSTLTESRYRSRIERHYRADTEIFIEGINYA